VNFVFIHLSATPF